MFVFQLTVMSLGSELLTNDTVVLLLYVIIGVSLLFIFGIVVHKIIRRLYRVPLSFQRVVLKVMLPKYKSRKEQEGLNLQQVQEEVGIMETLYSSLGGLKAQRGLKAWLFGRSDHFSFEIVAHDKKIAFYVVVPLYMQRFMEEQIQAQFPTAQIEEMEEYNMFNPTGESVGSYVKFRRDFFFPIKTYKKMEADPLNNVTNSLSKLAEGDGAVIQIVMRSAKKEWHAPGPKIASEMSQGKSFKEARSKVVGSGFLRFLYEMFSLLGSMIVSKGDETSKNRTLSQFEQEMAKGLEEKSSKAGLDCNIRVITSSASKDRAQAIMKNVLNSLSQYNIYEYGNSFKAVTPRTSDSIIHDYIYRVFQEKQNVVLNTEELASLFHFPLPSTETPTIEWLLGRKLPPPTNMATEGLVLGHNFYRGRDTDVVLAEADRRRHMYIIGMTGTGKSVYMKSLIRQDIIEGRGCCYIDPHGDAIDEILQYVPKERVDDVIVFDPSDFERPMGLNLLEFDTPEQKTFVVNEMLQIFDKLYDLKATGGPMFEQYMRNSILLMMEDMESGATIMEIPKILSDEDYRRYKLSKAKTKVVKDFWEKEAQKAGGEASLENMVPYITSKLTPFIANDLMRPIVSQQKSSINIRDVMDSKKILLVKLAKGKIGDINANLLGMILVGKMTMAALGRVDIPEEEREDFFVYIDEFQNFLTDTIKVILSEARKYRLCLTIAHQYIGQLTAGGDTSFRDAVFGNVGTKVSFRVGSEDAEFLEKDFAPALTANDIINVPKYNAYVKLLIQNENPPAFNFQPYFHKPDNEKIMKAIIELSRLKYGRDRSVVEAEIEERQNRVQADLDDFF